MKKMIADTFKISASVFVIATVQLQGLTRLNFNRLIHRREAASDTPGSRISIGITMRNVKTSLNDVGERRLAIIQSAMMPIKVRETPDK